MRTTNLPKPEPVPWIKPPEIETWEIWDLNPPVRPLPSYKTLIAHVRGSKLKIVSTSENMEESDCDCRANTMAKALDYEEELENSLEIMETILTNHKLDLSFREYDTLEERIRYIKNILNKIP